MNSPKGGNPESGGGNEPVNATDARPLPGARAFFANPLGLMVVAVLGALAAYKGLSSLTGICAVLVAAGVMARVWGRLALSKLEFSVSLEPARVFAGEDARAVLRVSNNKFLPLSWVEASYGIPAKLAPQEEEANARAADDRKWLRVRTPLLWFQWAEFPHTLCCRSRGAHQLGPKVLCTGDIFGLLVREKRKKALDELIVYPRIYELEQLGLPARFPLGATRAADRLFEDPARSVGLREYTPGTPLKYIHWKASARQQRLQVKVFEPTTMLQVALFIDVESFTDQDRDDDFELAVSIAASLAWHVAGQAQPVGLFANGHQTGREDGVMVSPGTGRAHLSDLLEGLARLERKPMAPLPDLMGWWIKEVVSGDTLIFIADKVSPKLSLSLDALVRRGFKVWVVQTKSWEEKPSAGYAWLGAGHRERRTAV